MKEMKEEKIGRKDRVRHLSLWGIQASHTVEIRFFPEEHIELHIETLGNQERANRLPPKCPRADTDLVSTKHIRHINTGLEARNPRRRVA